MREYTTEGPIDPERQDESIRPEDADTGRGLSLREWVLERVENCERIASIKQNPEDRQGWLEDAEYFRRLLKLIAEEPPSGDPIASLNSLMHAVLEDGIGLAIERNNLVVDDDENQPEEPNVDSVIQDAWLALNGVGTCEDVPTESLTAVRNYIVGLLRKARAEQVDTALRIFSEYKATESREAALEAVVEYLVLRRSELERESSI